MIFANLIAPTAYAISVTDLSRLYDNTPFYDPNSVACSNNGGTTSTTTTTTTLAGNDNLQKIFNFFANNGFTSQQAAGIVGNIMVESGGDPEKSQLDQKDYQNPPRPDDGTLGWGIVQWTPASKIVNAPSLSGPAYLLSTQVGFLLAQLNGTSSTSSEKQAGNMLKQVTSGVTAPDGHQYSIAWHAAQVFLTAYERAADHDTFGNNARIRGGFADQLLAQYGAGSTNPPPSGGTTGCNTSTAGVSGACDIPAPTSGYVAVKEALFSKFKINLVDATDTDWATQTYNTMCVVAKAPAYFSKLMAAGPITVDLIPDGMCGAGHADANTGIQLHGTCRKPIVNRFVLTHELGHMFAARNWNIRQAFDKQVWGQATTLPTLNCQHDYDNEGGHGPYEDECWADMIGEYFVWFELKYFENTDFKQYASQYPAYYNFARDSLFGGVQYSSF
jgi:hypothetical protein